MKACSIIISILASNVQYPSFIIPATLHHELLDKPVSTFDRGSIRTIIVLFPDPPPKRKGGSG